jgi:hypothetical protein
MNIQHNFVGKKIPTGKKLFMNGREEKGTVKKE